MNIKITRHKLNPLITPKDVKPTFDNFKVDCVFNAGVTKYQDETILLLRVAESVIVDKEGDVGVPLLEEKNNNYELTIKTFNSTKDADKYIFTDSRSLWVKDQLGHKKIKYLTSMSHLRIARSKNGIDFEIDDKPFIFPNGKYEAWGIEDPRITKIDGEYLINYTAVSEYGAGTVLVKTKDFKSYKKIGVIFPPENKDVSLLPEKINGLYYAYHRPVPKAIGNPDIWIASSPDLIHWGNHQHMIGVSGEDSWENGRIGGGAPSFKTEKGWIHIYHAADKDNRYCLGAFITDLNDPGKVIAKTKKPILEPVDDYEVNGFFGNVVFTCGLIVEDGIVKIYYGAADEVMALAEIKLEEIYKALEI